MGGFLDKPITTKSTQVGQGKIGDHLIRYGVSAMQGWRLEMEDAHVSVTEVGGKPIGLFCVFDGHAGKKAALHASENISRILSLQDGFERAESDPNALGEALGETYMDIDLDLLDLPKFRDGSDHSGTTALSVCLTPTHYIFANAGDSRAILVGGPSGTVIFSTADHKPDNPEEMARIQKAGATVFEHRVNGDLAVSRALGDFFYKRVAGIPPAEQPVTAKPDVTVVPRNVDQDQFLLLACDGIWDVVSNEVCAQFVLDKMNIGHGIGRICELLIDHCLELSSHDNMSVVLIAFPAAPKQIGTFREPIARTNSSTDDRGGESEE
jgi:serine/threonine protein phosphatase PrpC